MVALTATEPPHEATHWTGAAMAKAAGISVSSVQRIWRAHGLAPHRVRRFKLSNDPDFVPRLRDVVGLYVDPPAHAVLLAQRRRDLLRHAHQAALEARRLPIGRRPPGRYQPLSRRG